MKRIARLATATAFVLGAISACSPAAEPPPVTAPEIPVAETTPPPAADITLDVLTADGIGPLTIGMTKAEVVAAVRGQHVRIRPSPHPRNHIPSR